LRATSRPLAFGFSSLVFAALHAGNRGISAVAVVNLVLAGILLALAFERYSRLWFPIGIHFVWNVLSGPILGYPVSGYVSDATVLQVTGAGPALLTGGEFGIEASLWMTAVEAVGIVLLMKKTRNVEC